VKTPQQIKEYAQIAHLYFAEGTFSEKEVYNWMGDYGLTVNKLLKTRIEFTYYIDLFETKMTIWKNGKAEVKTNI